MPCTFMTEGTHAPRVWCHVPTSTWLILPLVTESPLPNGKLILAHALSLYLYFLSISLVGGAREVSVGFKHFLGL